ARPRDVMKLVRRGHGAPRLYSVASDEQRTQCFVDASRRGQRPQLGRCCNRGGAAPLGARRGHFRRRPVCTFAAVGRRATWRPVLDPRPRRPRDRQIPVIVVTARGQEPDRVRAFELGADDFVTKPFSVRELMLRVRAVLRRGSPAGPEQLRHRVGPVRIDEIAHRAYVDGNEIELTALEFKLLATLMARAGRLQTREVLLRDVWQLSGDQHTRTVDTHVKRLREKLGEGRDLIETVRGAGYRMSHPGDA